jgi:hypothetical protein
MKTLLSALLLFGTSLAFADVAVYNGAMVTKTISVNGTRTVTSKFIEVVDLANSQIVVITLGVDKGKRTFSIGAAEDVVKTEVQDSRSALRKFTILTQGTTATDGGTGVTTVTSFVQVGGNLQVTIKTGQKVGLPRNLQGTATLITTAGADVNGPIPSTYVDVKSTVVLQELMSRVSNDAGDTLAAAVQRIKADLLAKGYIEV